ncbi:MAG: hypothetical protein EOO24_15500 [Comamonadaceae bacterium]|nr:MAG: hypothetical protein EOO24_15500 [Comamonadaceae bacterium]
MNIVLAAHRPCAARVLRIAALLLAAPLAHSQPTHSFAFTVRADQSLGRVNANVLGTNLEWFNYGDSVLTGEGTHRPALIDFARQMQPTVLRYWAGDLYEWYRGMPGQMGPNVVPFGDYAAQPTWFGTQQFLEFSKAIGASSMVTLNVYQGWIGGADFAPGTDAVPAIHAAGWVEQINSRVAQGWPSSIAGQGNLGRVGYWEVGNEPYLQSPAEPGAPNGRSIAPERFAARAAQTAQAITAVDPAAQVLLPLSPGVRNGKAASAYWRNASGAADTDHYIHTVLGAMPAASIDAISLHTGYMPGADAGRVDLGPNVDRLQCPATYYWAAMSSAPSVAANMDAIDAVVKARYSSRFRSGVPQYALTEYGPVFSSPSNPVLANTGGACAADSYLGYTQADLSRWGYTPAGGLYVADLIRLLAARPNLMVANHWSLHNNHGADGTHRFGAFVDTAEYRNDPKPIYQVLQLWSGVLLPAGTTRVGVVATARQTRATASIGYAEARTIPVVEAFATRQTVGASQRLQVLMINKDPARAGVGKLTLRGATLVAATHSTLSSSALLGDDGRAAFTSTRGALSPSGQSVSITMPPGSVAVVTLQL